MTTLPVCVASVEKSFSSLRRIKTWVRFRMSEDRLSNMAVIHADKNEHIDHKYSNRLKKTEN